MRRVLFVCALGACLAACGGKASPTPTAPSATTPTRIVALSGNMAFGDHQAGTTSTATLDIRNDGDSTLTVTGIAGPDGYDADWKNGTISAGGVQTVTVTFSPVTEQSYDGTLTVNGNQTSGTNTISVSGTGTTLPGARTTFSAGQYLVGSDIVSGRYYTDPADECYWARQSGLGGTLGEILADDVVGFDAGQWIVDILRSDRAFETGPDCGTWFPTPRRGLEANITPGMWRVETQINAGRYRANAAYGCYWERMRNFQGTLGRIIANDFVSSPGQQLVEISSSDVGFQSDDACGTWTRVTSLVPSEQEAKPLQSLADIESNWAARRRENGLR